MASPRGQVGTMAAEPFTIHRCTLILAEMKMNLHSEKETAKEGQKRRRKKASSSDTECFEAPVSLGLCVGSASRRSTVAVAAARARERRSQRILLGLIRIVLSQQPMHRRLYRQESRRQHSTAAAAAAGIRPWARSSSMGEGEGEEEEAAAVLWLVVSSVSRRWRQQRIGAIAS